MKKDADLALVTVFGLGRLRPAPGTWGSLPPVVLAGVLMAAGLGPGEQPVIYNLILAAVVIFFTLACASLGDKAEAKFLKKDPSEVVADETAGQAVALMFLPAAAVATPGLAIFTLIYAFLAFRLMDILKPWPAYQIQKVPGGWGVVLDDLLAGFYALIVVQLISRLLLNAW
jgi:phosphatidylglycerophosphatase A